MCFKANHFPMANDLNLIRLLNTALNFLVRPKKSGSAQCALMASKSRTARTAEDLPSASTAAEGQIARTAEDPPSVSTAGSSHNARNAEDPPSASTAAEGHNARTAEDPPSASTAGF